MDIFSSDNDRILFGRVKLILKVHGFAENLVPMKKVDNRSMIDDSEPIRVLVFSISLIDLISVHRMTANCPCVNLACGKFVAVTQVFTFIILNLF